MFRWRMPSMEEWLPVSPFVDEPLPVHVPEHVKSTQMDDYRRTTKKVSKARQQKLRFRTQPVTFEEIREVDEEVVGPINDGAASPCVGDQSRKAMRNAQIKQMASLRRASADDTTKTLLNSAGLFGGSVRKLGANDRLERKYFYRSHDSLLKPGLSLATIPEVGTPIMPQDKIKKHFMTDESNYQEADTLPSNIAKTNNNHQLTPHDRGESIGASNQAERAETVEQEMPEIVEQEMPEIVEQEMPEIVEHSNNNKNWRRNNCKNDPNLWQSQSIHDRKAEHLDPALHAFNPISLTTLDCFETTV